MRLLTVLFVFLFTLAAPAFATEVTGQDLTITCNAGVLIVEVGDHVVDHAAYRVDADDGTFEHFDWTEPLDVGEADFVDVWIELDGVEVDPRVTCEYPEDPPDVCPPEKESQPWNCVITGPVGLVPISAAGLLFVTVGVAGVRLTRRFT